MSIWTDHFSYVTKQADTIDLINHLAARQLVPATSDLRAFASVYEILPASRSCSVANKPFNSRGRYPFTANEKCRMTFASRTKLWLATTGQHYLWYQVLISNRGIKVSIQHSAPIENSRKQKNLSFQALKQISNVS